MADSAMETSKGIKALTEVCDAYLIARRKLLSRMFAKTVYVM